MLVALANSRPAEKTQRAGTRGRHSRGTVSRIKATHLFLD
jgi:hypothetical protein